ncbi:MAG: sigma-54-dependent Fis family transcriptional regulator [Thermoanaerobaculia bacterium]|nr:sigma-54-dependent Fis family transcriptional regulator [Thermoanaerobaculia bacterium]
MAHRILICDDESDIRESLRAILLDEGFDVTAVAAGPNAVAESPDHDALLLDIKMPGQDGLETLAQIRKRGVATPVIMISGHGDVKTAMEAIRAGADDFLEKPLATEHVLNALRRVLDASRLTRENQELRSRLGLTRLVGDAPVMKKLVADVQRVAPTPATILIVGPSGTGKELVARSLHEGSAVRNGPFIQVNCAAIPETLIESELFGHEKGSFTGAERKQVGKFVEADGGTIFLDEIGDMSLSAQAKVLRVLQEGEVEPVGSPRVVRVKVRVVAATNRDLTEMIGKGKFREDLFYRLNVIPLRTPALSEHPEDVPALVLHFADLFARTNNYRPKRFTDEALMALAARPWPGNVRELKNHVERLMIMTDGDVVDAIDVEAPGEARPAGPVVVRGGRVVREGEPEAGADEPPPPSVAGVDDVWSRLLSVRTLQEFQDEAEKLFLVARLAEYGGNVTRTAEAVDTPRSNLYKKLDRYGLKKREDAT